MKEYHEVLYAIYTNFLLRIVFLLTNLIYYFDEMYVPLETNESHTRSSYQKLNAPHRKTNVTQKAFFYVGPSLWINLNKTLKTSTSLNAFKHNIKKHYFNKLKKKES